MAEKSDKKVLFVTNYRELYGANNSLLQLMLELRQHGVSPTVLLPGGTSQPGNDLVMELKSHDIPYVETNMRLDKHPAWEKTVANYMLALAYRKDAYKAIAGMDFDIVHSNSSTMSVGAYIARKLGKPHVWHLREYGDLDYGMKTPFGKWYQKVIYGGHNTFIAISKGIMTHYAKFIGGQGIHLIYNGIKQSLRRPEVDRPYIEICIVGLLRKEKGQMDLIIAANELVNGRGILNFHITVVGSGDPAYMASMEDFVSRHDLTDYITMAGRRNDVAELLTKMDIGVMASAHEAFGRVTVEYMMAGLAVVASDGGANPEIIEDGKTGLIYPVGDTSVLADHLEMLITHPEKRRVLAHDGQEEAEKRFSSKANSDAVYNLYNEILKTV